MTWSCPRAGTRLEAALAVRRESSPGRLAELSRPSPTATHRRLADVEAPSAPSLVEVVTNSISLKLDRVLCWRRKRKPTACHISPALNLIGRGGADVKTVLRSSHSKDAAHTFTCVCSNECECAVLHSSRVSSITDPPADVRLARGLFCAWIRMMQGSTYPS